MVNAHSTTMRRARAGHRAGFFVAPTSFVASALVAKDHGTLGRLLRFCNVGSFPQNDRRPAAGATRRPRDSLLSPGKSCRYNGLVAFCRASGHACGGEPVI